MREHRNDWSLAADIHLFSYMQQFSQNLLSETHGTLKCLDNLESDIATTCVEVGNIGNRFWTLSDTQFVENRVYDDDDITSPTAPPTLQVNQTEDNEAVVIQRLRDAIQNGIHVLDSKFETVQVPASDSDEEDSSPHSGVILKPVNRYKDRRLPHLIGSAEFTADDTLGLREVPSDEETDDFKSASDKSNDSVEDSEDSDVESDQPKAQHILFPKPSNNTFDPLNLKLPGLEAQMSSNASSPPSGEGSLVTHKKPTFSSWQPTDLWASEEEDEKRLGDNIRPSSANSSISSAQSSIMSEPIKKTSEDFGKSGTGRQAVLVQDDHSDLFGSKGEITQPQTKEFVPAGGVKIFGGDFNPFSNRNQFKDDQDDGFLPAIEPSRSEKDDVDEDIFAKKFSVPTKLLPTVSSSILNKKKEISLFDDEEEDDLFSSKSIESKTKSQPSSLHSSTVQFGSNKSEPDDEGFFSNSSIIPESRKSHSIFSDDLFADESDDLFSTTDTNKQKNYRTSSSVSQGFGDSLFSDDKPSAKGIGASKTGGKAAPQKHQPQNFGGDIFGDGEDLFGNVAKLKGDDLFGEVPIKSKPSSSLVNQESKKIQGSIKKDLFDEIYNDNDDLFSVSTKSSIEKNPRSQTVNQDSLFGKTIKEPSKSGKEESPEAENGLFGVPKISSDLKNKNIKGKPSVLKPKKGLENRSLFDSDSDDDLFSSPQGSLSSRKSIQSVNETPESNDKEDKKKSSDSNTSRLPKTDFSSIFSNSQDETPSFLLDKETKKPSNLFGDDKDLFSSLSSNVKTPDLFSNNSLLSKNSLKTEKDSSLTSEENKNEIKSTSESSKAQTKTLVEALNKKLTEKSEKTPVESGALKTDIFNDSLFDNEEKPIMKKLDPPKTLDIKPISETLMGDKSDESKQENKTDIPKPPVSKKPTPSVTVEKSLPKDSTDGEVISPPSPSKIPGKLKASQLIKINPAALLPGARPSKAESQAPNIPNVRESPDPEVPSPPTVSTTVPDMPQKSSLLHSVNKERVKIPSKRRPSSRRARQESLKASMVIDGTEADTTSSNVVPPTSTLMSPSTDEEDLFGVPPLDVVYDVKAVSPSVDIFGTPTVLSPVQPTTTTTTNQPTNKLIPSTFVSTPFVHSQPPPLDEDQEEGSNHEDDLFGSQNNLISSLTKERKPSHEVQSKKTITAEDIFSDVDEDGLFRGIKEAPPPLVDDDNDDDEEYDELFMTREKKDNVFSKPLHSGSVIAALESIPKEDTKRSVFSQSTEPVSYFPSINTQKMKTGVEKDPLFTARDLTTTSTNSLFSTLEESKVMGTEDPLFDSPLKNSSEVTKDTFNNSLKKDSIFSDLSNEEESSLFSKVPKEKSSEIFSADKKTTATPIHPKVESQSKGESIVSNLDYEEDSFLSSKKQMVSTSELFSSDNSKNISDKLGTEFKEDENQDSDDELFGSQSKVSTTKPSSITSEIKVTTSKHKDENAIKKDTLFGDDEEEASNLFSSVLDKKVKVKSSVKSSLFGDEEDDDDIFGSLPSSKKTESKAAPSTSQSTKGSSLKTMKTGNVGSSKPVKLETKQTFSDPLFSQEDQ
ncbi:WASH complex subunit 2 isoform X2 [Macrosteles quadrilineatus]|nr:WASH complex subunit 2 isoform X2 [Macrosteles quadrilineatus]